MIDKVHSQSELSHLVDIWRSSGKRTGFTNGCFDILHVGHVRYLDAAASLCDVLVVGVNSDMSVKRLKGEDRPVNPEFARLEVLAALESVSAVTLFADDTPLELIKMLKPDIIFKGGDWKEEDIVGAGHVRSLGGEVKVIPYVDGFSTTGIIDKMKEGDNV